MDKDRTVVGLDAGAVFVKLAVLDESGTVATTRACRHQGNPLAAAREALRDVANGKPLSVGLTGVNAPAIAERLGVSPVDAVQAEIAAVTARVPGVRNIMNVGGGSVTLIQLDEAGRFLDCSGNSLCAAGTGSFLDQQAHRLGIDYADLENFPRVDDPPSIATRCSVFAKSDLIHRQQEGYSKAALWSGLCRGMTGTFLNTLLRGRPLQGLTVVTGGVSQNTEVLRCLRERYGDMVQTYDLAPFSCAEGAAQLHNGHLAGLDAVLAALEAESAETQDTFRRPPLAFHKTRYPDFAVAEAWVDAAGNEMRVTQWPAAGPVRAYLGLDVGSTSTKLMLIDEQGEALADIYRRTAGDPVGATKQLFAALAELGAARGTGLEILGVATTGSGRKLVGAVVGADVVVNEITAHLAGALHVDPGIDTIFEIGGQDAKYIRARGGRIVDSNMNYVCAAGTGSFVEEQAAKLGLKLDEIGDVAMGIAPPVTSDRCTVFMEQDVDRLVRQGYTREACIAAVLCSVVKNYLTKVVGRRPISRERVFFQGATARNKGLAAAFENVLGVEVVVSPYCHVMGGYGAALLARKQAAENGGRSRFKGLDLSRRKIALRTEPCELCRNTCTITFADIEGEDAAPSWGYMCGRDPEATAVRRNDAFAPFQKRLGMLRFGPSLPPDATPRAVVGIPLALSAYSLLPLWRGFFGTLGCALKLTGQSTPDRVRRGAELTAADFCFPVKLAHGAVEELVHEEGLDCIFLPHTIQAPPNPAATNTHFCPYVQALPSVVQSSLRARGVDTGRILSPVVDMSHPERETVGNLHAALGDRLGVSRAAVAAAWREGQAQMTAFREARRAEGRRLMAELEASGERAIVVMGRPYSTLDMGANLALPRKMAEFGFRIVPMDLLPYDVHDLHPDLAGMYWQYGQEILCAATFIREHPALFPVFLTSFSCGPDSFLLTQVETVMGDKPLLAIELDEHGGDAGYLTRIEAFLDVVDAYQSGPRPAFSLPRPAAGADALRGRTLWIPPMHPIASRLFGAAFRAAGFDAKALPPETQHAFELGRQHTRGSECLPAALTVGAFMETCADGGRHALFMPCTEGPCRFGQYATLHRLALNRVGHADVPIMSPSAGNTYLGLTRRLRARIWEAILVGDAITKAGCRLRPYEREAGAVNRVAEAVACEIERVMETGGNIRAVLADGMRRLRAVPIRDGERKPLVGIVGEIYVRCNPFANSNLIDAIEQAGGEAWLAPGAEWVMYCAAMQDFNLRGRHAKWGQRLVSRVLNACLQHAEHRYAAVTAPVLADRREPAIGAVLREGQAMLPQAFAGEAIVTIGRAAIFAQQGAAMVVNVAPFGCMPGTVTAALCRELQTRTGTPIVSLFYDGEKDVNQRLGVYLSNLQSRASCDSQR